MNEAKTRLRLLLVDDHPVVREGLRAILATDAAIEVVGEASNGEESLEKVQQLAPEVVLMDIRMPGVSGIDATRRIKELKPSTVVVLLTMYDSEMYVVEGLRAGAAGYLLKDSSRELLCHAIKAGVDGGTMVCSRLLRQAVGLTRSAHQRGDASAASGQGLKEQLSQRELEVLHCVSQGQTNKEIGRQLHLAEVTVKKHVQSLMGKLGASDRTQAVMIASRLGLVQ